MAAPAHEAVDVLAQPVVGGEGRRQYGEGSVGDEGLRLREEDGEEYQYDGEGREVIIQYVHKSPGLNLLPLRENKYMAVARFSRQPVGESFRKFPPRFCQGGLYRRPGLRPLGGALPGQEASALNQYI